MKIKLLILTIFLVGCSSNPTIYSNNFADFNLEIPYKFTLEEEKNEKGTFSVINNEDKNDILIDSHSIENTLTLEEILARQKALFENFCEATQNCAEIVSSEEKTFNTMDILKLKTKWSDTSNSNQAETTSISYLFSKDNKLIEIYMVDIKNPEEEKEFEEIMKTIKAGKD